MRLPESFRYGFRVDSVIDTISVGLLEPRWVLLPMIISIIGVFPRWLRR